MKRQVPMYIQESRQERQAASPKTSYPEQLPISARKDELVEAIRRDQVLIVAGDTGCGKSTQIPKLCLDAGRGISGLIGCTQPRRVAAVTIAQRIAEELGEELGLSVAYKIRFDERSGPHPFIKLMTDGVLLMEAQSDRLLRRYDTIIVDEAHERSLNIDFILGLMRTILPKRRDLKVIITSATMDTEKFSAAFGKAPIIRIEGRLYPVEVRYRPPATDEEGDVETCVEGAVAAVADLRKDRERGDVLIFMPTEQDIREACEMLTGRFGDEMTILPMYSRLPWGEQKRVFQPSSRQKIVVATNVAETSLTIPGIRYVIDTGLARIAQYNPRTRTSGLPILPISRSSADQRQGRCGRVRNGICLRLYDREDYLARPAFTAPEIIRANLAGVILRMLFLDIGDIFTFPFLDPPAKKQINDALDILTELGAIRREDKPVLTDIGLSIARLPLDPRIARMIIEAVKRGCLPEILVIAAALSIVDPRERPQEKAAQAAQAQAHFLDPDSDFVAYLRIWDAFQKAWDKTRSRGQLRKFCREHFLSYRRMREWQDLHDQLRRIVADDLIQGNGRDRQRLDNSKRQKYFASEKNDRPADNPAKGENKFADISKAVLSGLLSGVAAKKEKNIYNAPKGREAMIFPGSGLFKKGGAWIVAAEWVETSRLFARTIANIEAEWIEEVAGPLCRTTYSEPHWSRARGEVQAFAQVSLFGTVIIPRRIASYGRIDPITSQEIFIRSGIMMGELKRTYPFQGHNEKVIEKVRIMENKLRRPGALFDEECVFAFYRRRLPGIYDERTFGKYIRRQGGDGFLRMEEDDILLTAPNSEELNNWPDETIIRGVPIPLTYRFTPGSPDDGVSVRIPAALLADPETLKLETSVPGLLREQVQGLLRGLPKVYRRQLPALKEVTEKLLRHLDAPEQSLPIILSRLLKNHYAVSVPPAAWPIEALPEQMRMRYIVVADTDGRELAGSRNLPELHKQFLVRTETERFQEARMIWERNDIQQWDFEELPVSVPLGDPERPAGVAYPALEERNGKVNLRLFSSFTDAEESHRRGVAALYEKLFDSELKYLRKTLLPAGSMKIWAEAFGGINKVRNILYDKVLYDLFSLSIRNTNDFNSHVDSARPVILPRGQEVLELAAPILEANFLACETLEGLEKKHRTQKTALAYIHLLHSERKDILPLDFLIICSESRLKQLPRYLRALSIRAERGMLHLEKALTKTREVSHYLDEGRKMLQEADQLMTPEKKAAVDEYLFMVEEYKVSLFAQELKTVIPVSPKRLAEKIKAIREMS